jgi:hypothetical protein
MKIEGNRMGFESSDEMVNNLSDEQKAFIKMAENLLNQRFMLFEQEMINQIKVLQKQIDELKGATKTK